MSFACGIAGVLLFAILAAIAQVIVRRAGSRIAPVAILAIAAIVSHVASILVGAMTVAHFQYWNAASVFGLGVMLYVFAFGAVYKSVSLEILLDLSRRPGAAAPLDDIVYRKVPEIFRGRTDILVEGGQVERSVELAGPRFLVTASGRATALRIGALRRAFTIGDTGLYDFAEPADAADKTRSR
jgi:hypothetical protein